MITYLYFLFQDDVIVYVGQTKDLAPRIKTHYKTKGFNAVKYIETDYFFGAKLERFCIAYLKPKYNSRIDWKDFEVKDLDLKSIIKYKEPEIL